MNDSQAEDTDSSPDHINNLRERMMKQLTALLESQTRTRNFATSITTLVKRVHTESLEGIEQVLGRIDDPTTADSLRQSMINCRNLDIALDCLVDERRRQWYKNGKYLKQVIDELNETTSYLASILVEKDLLEKQSQVLENIIFSHEKVSQWKEFVQEILTSFHAIFPFNFFFIAFAEEHGLSLYFYYLGDYSDTAKQEVRQRLSKDMLRQLNLPEDAPLDIEEFHIPGRSKKIVIDDIKMITVPVPNQSYGLAGLLGIAFASIDALSMQEQTIIRSLLSVMVMVVGSSKALSRTLSELEYYSVHDPLTGIHNRRYFNDMLDYEIGRSERHRHEFSVLLLDLDDFKDINDSYGHPLGDEVLKKLPNRLPPICAKAISPRAWAATNSPSFCRRRRLRARKWRRSRSERTCTG